MKWDEETLLAQWVIDSETGERKLMDCKTNKVILTETELEPFKEE